MAAAIDHFGGLDVLVNNAQSSVPGVPLEQIDDATIALTLESGLLGTLYHMQAAFPHMKERGGSIINFGSREGVFGGVGFGIYAATKEAIRGLSRTAAREWGKHGIRVNVICPAASEPGGGQVSRRKSDRKPSTTSRRLRSATSATPRAISARSLCSSPAREARYVTGQTINADGGQTMF